MTLQTQLELKLAENRIDFKNYTKMAEKAPKYFVIMFGPPASGKGTLKNYIIEFLAETFVDIDVDQLVLKECEKDSKRDCKNMTQLEYFELRKTADQKSDDLLIDSVVNRRNILWETTGTNQTWVIYALSFMKEYNYRILLAIPVTQINLMVTRCLARQQAANCDKTYLSTLRSKSFTNFPTIANLCDRILVFDNSQKMLLIYDSFNHYCDINARELKKDPDQSLLHEYIYKQCA